jgi:diguanylate cyclase (GGDEF)-like protein
MSLRKLGLCRSSQPLGNGRRCSDVQSADSALSVPATVADRQTDATDARAGQAQLGRALQARIDDVSASIVQRWDDNCLGATDDDAGRIRDDIIRTTQAATLAIVAYLTEGKMQTDEQKRAESATGKAPLRDTISLVDLTKLYLYWRDATIQAIREEAKRLRLDAGVTERAVNVVRVGSDGSVVRMVKVFDRERRQLQDELKREQSRLAHEALHDALTGLPNRKLFFDRLTHVLTRSARNTLATAIVFIDIDDFKKVNDNHGHLAGDRLLIAVASRLRDRVRAADTVARLGGDEFVVLCEDLLSPAEETTVIVERLNGAFARPFNVGDEMLNVAASMGLAVATDVHDPDVLLSQADHAMYCAKQDGKRRMQYDGRECGGPTAAPQR